ncbi:transporter substrate-binding domain-containing protein [Klebsiella variicola subsp. variicola]|nr:transporter substrate-binding domain-containing protein [Klebsiella variicola subsp. variicola]
MYVNPTRAEQVDFVPYLKIGSRVVVRKGNPANITGRDLSLCGKNIAVTLGGIEESQARAGNQRCVEAKKTGHQRHDVPRRHRFRRGRRPGRADAEFLSTPGTVALFTEKAGMFEAVGAEFEANTHIAFAVRKGDTAPAQAAGARSAETRQKWHHTQLIKKWNFPDSVALF